MTQSYHWKSWEFHILVHHPLQSLQSSSSLLLEYWSVGVNLICYPLYLQLMTINLTPCSKLTWTVDRCKHLKPFTIWLLTEVRMRPKTTVKNSKSFSFRSHSNFCQFSKMLLKGNIQRLHDYYWSQWITTPRHLSAASISTQ